MSKKPSANKDEPESFISPEQDIAEDEATLPGLPRKLTRLEETRASRKSPKRTVDVLSNDGQTAILVWSDTQEQLTCERRTTRLSLEAFLKLYPVGGKNLKAPA